MRRALFQTKHADKFTSPKHNLLVFDIKAYQRVGALFLETSNTPVGVVQQCCQLVWKILLKIILPIVLPAFLQYVLLVFFYHSKSQSLSISRIYPPGKFVGQLYEKRLAHLAHCPESQVVLKTSNKKNCILQPMSASRCSATHNCFRSSLRILFTAFSETKTQL